MAGVSALLAALLALFLAYAERLSRRPGTAFAVRTATLGYALPGAMLAVGVLVPLTAIDKSLARFLNAQLDLNAGLLLTRHCGGADICLPGALSHCGLQRLPTAAWRRSIYVWTTPRAASAPRRAAYWAKCMCHVPLMRGAVASAVLLVFIDVMKELPATLILRPFNFETLATRVYRLASDERLAEASTAALAIVLVGVAPALLLAFQAPPRSRRPRSATV